MKETTDSRSANRTLVCLHPDDLTAVNTQTHVPTGKDDCVLGGCVAYYAFFLAFVSQIGCIIIDSIDVVQIHYLVVV